MRITQNNIDIGKTEGYKCELTMVKNGVAQVVAAEIDSPLSTIKNARITPTGSLRGVDLRLSYDYYNEVNYDGDGKPLQAPIKAEDSKYQWYKKTAIEVDGRFIAIPGATGKKLSQTFAEILETEAYRCEVSVYDADGAKGKVVNVDIDAYKNQMLGASVVSQTRTGAANLVDGSLSTKWEVATTTYPSPHTAVFDLGALKEIDRFKVFHSPSNPFVDDNGGMDRYNDKNPEAITYDFDVSYSEDNVNWVTKAIRANKAPITDIRLDGSVKARYVKIDVIRPNRVFLAPTNFWDTTNRLRILQMQALVSVRSLTQSATLYENGAMTPLGQALGKTVDVKVNFGGLPEGKVNVLVATYKDSGAMIEVKEETVNVDSTGDVDCTIKGFAVSADTAKMKAFIWEYGTYIPLTDAIIVD
jgi:hypothetical protein